MHYALELCLSRKGKKVGAWLLLLVGIAGFTFSLLTGKEIPTSAVTLYCFLWGTMTGHSVAEVMKGAKHEPAP